MNNALQIAVTALIDIQNHKGTLIYTRTMEDTIERALVEIEDLSHEQLPVSE